MLAQILFPNLFYPNRSLIPIYGVAIPSSSDPSPVFPVGDNRQIPGPILLLYAPLVKTWFFANLEDLVAKPIEVVKISSNNFFFPNSAVERNMSSNSLAPFFLSASCLFHKSKQIKIKYEWSTQKSNKKSNKKRRKEKEIGHTLTFL